LDICEVKVLELVGIRLDFVELKEKMIGVNREKVLQVAYAKAPSFQVDPAG
jgi:hypothetical protein